MKEFFSHTIQPIALSNFFLDTTIQKIYSFGELPNGWNYGQGIAASNAAIETAINVYQTGLSSWFNGNAFPDTNGGIILSLFINDNFVYVTISPDGNSLSWRHEKGIGQEYEIVDEAENVTLYELLDVLKSIQTACFSFAPLTSGIMTPSVSDFPATASKTLVTGYQSLRRPAQSLQVA